MDLEIRDAASNELEAASAVLSAAWEEYRSARDGRGEEDVRVMTSYIASVADVWSRLEDGSALIVAARGDHIVGTVTYYPPGSEHEGWPATWAAMRLLGVAPSERRQGIGRVLTDECIRRARAADAPVFGLHTSDIMAVARGMYERMGLVRAPEYDFRPSPGVVVTAYRLDLA
jgi:ribosomal protein S18 acetylase RimI-like enzyme